MDFKDTSKIFWIPTKKSLYILKHFMNIIDKEEVNGIGINALCF